MSSSIQKKVGLAFAWMQQVNPVLRVLSPNLPSLSKWEFSCIYCLQHRNLGEIPRLSPGNDYEMMTSMMRMFIPECHHEDHFQPVFSPALQFFSRAGDWGSGQGLSATCKKILPKLHCRHSPCFVHMHTDSTFFLIRAKNDSYIGVYNPSSGVLQPTW